MTHLPSFFKHKNNGSYIKYNKIIINLIDEFECYFGDIKDFLPMMKVFLVPMEIDVTVTSEEFQIKF